MSLILKSRVGLGQFPKMILVRILINLLSFA